MERICTKCGSPVDEGDTFCDICGEPFDEPEKAPVDEAPADTSENTKDAGQPSTDFVARNKESIIFTAVVLAVIAAAIVIVGIMTSNTPEGALKRAIGYRLAGDVNGSVTLDYESNFSKEESQSDFLERMRGNVELNVKHDDSATIKIKTESRLIDDPLLGISDLTNRKNQLSAMFRDTNQITDIRDLTYDLVDGDTVLMSSSAQAIKVNGKWYIFGVAQVALTI